MYTVVYIYCVHKVALCTHIPYTVAYIGAVPPGGVVLGLIQSAPWITLLLLLNQSL